MIIISRDVDTSTYSTWEAFKIATLMEKCGIQVINIQYVQEYNNWLIWGRGEKEAIEFFDKEEMKQFEEEEANHAD